MRQFNSGFQPKAGNSLWDSKLSHWIVGLILLFLSSQTAGLLHAEIHPFHKHTASCELFEQLAQPVDSGNTYTFSFFKPSPIIPYAFALVSVFETPFTAHFFSRAPPISF
ncbi:hypothetical protein [Thiomicrorhabdus sp.]|uniref:hypothetical protein n=1 Tax=Thiomicrorhabdus sp. TaxID=2039724 RepID=UPI002AA69235|nr:hypothetical protein [Thiomicrorhabdus sp.]